LSQIAHKSARNSKKKYFHLLVASNEV